MIQLLLLSCFMFQSFAEEIDLNRFINFINRQNDPTLQWEFQNHQYNELGEFGCGSFCSDSIKNLVNLSEDINNIATFILAADGLQLNPVGVKQFLHDQEDINGQFSQFFEQNKNLIQEYQELWNPSPVIFNNQQTTLSNEAMTAKEALLKKAYENKDLIKNYNKLQTLNKQLESIKHFQCELNLLNQICPNEETSKLSSDFSQWLENKEECDPCKKHSDLIQEHVNLLMREGDKGAMMINFRVGGFKPGQSSLSAWGPANDISFSDRDYPPDKVKLILCHMAEFHRNCNGFGDDETYLNFSQSILLLNNIDEVTADECSRHGFQAAAQMEHFPLKKAHILMKAPYPNPTTGLVKLDFSLHFSKETAIQIVDFSGKVVHQQNSSQALEEIDLSHLPNGTYTVKLLGKVATQYLTETYKIVLLK